MRCPICLAQLDVEPDIKNATHFDHTCPCGQVLQWDQPTVAVRGAVRRGPPAACTHPEVHKPGARVPLP